MVSYSFTEEINKICLLLLFFFFFNDTATTEIYTLSLHDALPICIGTQERPPIVACVVVAAGADAPNSQCNGPGHRRKHDDATNCCSSC